jgi:crossover junction endodeoxyribonuclease RuvC
LKVLGIDPGLKGGLAMVEDGRLIHVAPMPVVALENGKNRVSTDGLRDFLETCARDPDEIWIEEVGARPGQGVTSMFNFGFGCGVLLGFFRSACPEAVINYIRPQKWQKHFWDSTEDTKASSVEVAAALYGTATLIPAGCRTPHDGMSDALLIARYASDSR